MLHFVRPKDLEECGPTLIQSYGLPSDAQASSSTVGVELVKV